MRCEPDEYHLYEVANGRVAAGGVAALALQDSKCQFKRRQVWLPPFVRPGNFKQEQPIEVARMNHI